MAQGSQGGNNMGFFSRNRHDEEPPLFPSEDGTTYRLSDQERLCYDEGSGTIYVKGNGYTRNITQDELAELRRQETWGPLFG